MNTKINDYVTWVGKTDWELKKFHGDEFTTEHGSSYNAYLIRDEKTVLIDTVWLPYDREFVSNLKKQKGEHIWVCGGAVLAHSLIKNDSIDQYHIFVMPILLGGGISLFQGNIFPKKLHLLSVKKHNDIVEMVYQKKDTKR